MELREYTRYEEWYWGIMIVQHWSHWLSEDCQHDDNKGEGDSRSRTGGLFAKSNEKNLERCSEPLQGLFRRRRPRMEAREAPRPVDGRTVTGSYLGRIRALSACLTQLGLVF